MTKNLVLSLDFFPKIGGAHLWLYEVYKRWPSNVLLLAPSYSKMYSMQQRKFDLQDHGSLKIIRMNVIFSFSQNIFCDFMYFINILFFLNRIVSRRTLIYCYSLRIFPESFILSLLKKIGFNIKLITYAHGEEYFAAETSRLLLFYATYALKYTDLIISNSISTKNIIKSFAQRYKSALPPIQVINPGVDYYAYQCSVDEVQNYKKKFSFFSDSKKPMILVTISRLERRKNHIQVLKALSSLKKEFNNLIYIIAGEGEERFTLERAVKQLNLENNVLFLGQVSEKEKILTYLISDIHVLPSIRIGPMIEGYGIVFIEAAAAGLPSIAGNVGGQKEAVLHGKTGLVVDGNCLDQLIRALRLLILDEDLRSFMKKNAKMWAIKHDWNIIVKKIYKCIQSNLK